MIATESAPLHPVLRPRPRAVVIVVATVLGMVLTARLGVWQLDRAAQKEALQAALDGRGKLPTLRAEDLPRPAEPPSVWLYRRVRLHGRWLPGGTVFVDNRPMNGQSGFYVMGVLQLTDRSSVGAVLVQRGWAPRNAADRTALPPVATPPGDVEVEGHLAPAPSKLFEFAGAASADDTGPIRQNIEPVVHGRALGIELGGYSVVEEPTPGHAADGLSRDWARPVLGTSKHYGYAGQWFLLCALQGGLFLWYRVLAPWRARGVTAPWRPHGH